jgi:hypothetical protein
MTKFGMADSRRLRWLHDNYKVVRWIFRILAILAFLIAIFIISGKIKEHVNNQSKTNIDPPYINSIFSKIESELSELVGQGGGVEPRKLPPKSVEIELTFVVKQYRGKYLPVMVEEGTNPPKEEVQRIKITFVSDPRYRLWRKKSPCNLECLIPVLFSDEKDEDDEDDPLDCLYR